MIHGSLGQVLLDGRYRVGDAVGAGATGTVYAATHIGLGGKVAIKVPRLDHLPTSAIGAAIDAFLDEARTLARLRHPHLVAALDVALLPPDREGLRQPYLVMQWCDGPTLEAWLAQRAAPQSPEDTWTFLRPVFDAIAHAHDQGVVHRDIQPRNILIDTSQGAAPQPRVIDFGLAKLLGAGDANGSGQTLTMSAAEIFAPRYAAPEQLTGLRTGPGTDVFALALVLVEVIRGAPVHGDDEDARRAVLEGDHPTPRKLGLELGPWNEPIERALSARSRDRHANARELVAALDEADRASRTAPARPPARGAAPTYRPATRGNETRDSTRDDTGASVTLVGDTRDESGDLASRTLDTARASATTRRRRWAAMAAFGAVAVVVAGEMASLALGGPGAIRWLLRRARGTEPSAPALAGSSGPTADPAQPRILSSLTADELMARAGAAGLTRCKLDRAEEEVRVVVCREGEVELVVFAAAIEKARERVVEYAPRRARPGWAVRFAVGDGVRDAASLVVAAPPDRVEQLAAEVLAGTLHEEVRASVFRVPGKLAEWRGEELAYRIREEGGIVTSVMPVLSSTIVLFTLDDEEGYLATTWGDAEGHVARESPPGAYAIDGDVSLVVKHDGSLGTVAGLKRILGPTAAARFGQLR